MLKIINGGTSPNKRLGATNSHRVIRVGVARKRMEASEMLAIALADKSVDQDLPAVVETYPSIMEFALKTADFMTNYFPSTSGEHSSLLCEVLDLAAIGYHQTSKREPSEQIARFLADGVHAAARGILTYRASQHADEEESEQVWTPWEDGSLSSWMHWGAVPLTFNVEAQPTAEVRYVAGAMLQQRLLTYQSRIKIARARIEMHGVELF